MMLVDTCGTVNVVRRAKLFAAARVEHFSRYYITAAAAADDDDDDDEDDVAVGAVIVVVAAFVFYC